MLRGFLPDQEIVKNSNMLYIAIGILGATVMPHNLYLHSSIVQTRRYEETAAGKRMAVRYAFVDSTIALSFALFINAAILVVAAATFHRAGQTGVAEIQDAYKLLTPLLGVTGASAVFAFAELHLHRWAECRRRAADDHQKAGRRWTLALDELPDRADSVDDRGARGVGHELGERL